MALPPPFHPNPLVQKLSTIFTLSDDEKAAIDRVPAQVVEIKADQDIVRQGDRPSRSFALLEGFTCAYAVTGAGKRQILAFHTPGDMPDVQTLHLNVLDNSVGTITPCKVAFIQHDVLHDLCRRFPRITSALWRGTLIEAAVFRQWMVNIGQRDALSRMACSAR